MRRGPVALGLLVLAGCGSSAGGAGSAGSSPASSGEGAANAVLRTADSPLGPIAVAANGRTVYVFDEDGVGTSTCAGSCAALWPALSAETQEPAVDGVPGDVGTITRDDGTLQVTLDGMPLYTYAGDSDAGDVTGQGVDGVWWVVAAGGAEVTDAPGSAPAPGY
jgi:predicted lipoprotein with Yx(FWY)xxD motif